MLKYWTTPHSGSKVNEVVFQSYTNPPTTLWISRLPP